jgi:hypothetical protein
MGNSKSVALLIGGLIAVLALAQTPASPRALGSAPGPAPSGQRAARTSDVATRAAVEANSAPTLADDPCRAGARALEQYLALYTTPEPRSGGDPKVPPLRHLIALVPDPVESGYADYFDSALEGVQEAVALPGVHGTYVRDRGWLPWPRPDATPAAPRCWQSQPGVLIYRPSSDPETSPALVVLLVGETPTWGLQERQFEEALRIIDDFKAWWPGHAGGNEYRVLGPTFSGTAASLSAAIQKHESPLGSRFTVTSGTATNPAVQGTIERRPAGGGPSVQYWSATPDDTALLQSILNYLCDRGANCRGGQKNIALLTESLTTYGSAGTALEDSPYIELKFPPSLAPIRNQDPNIAGPSASSAAPPNDPPLPSGRPRTELSADTATAHDLELEAVLRDLSANHVRFIGVVATDATDVILLADRIRSQLPDVRLFTLSTDIRYLDPSYAQFLNGMLVAHVMPNAVGDHQPISLQNELVVSFFNAGRYLLGDERPALGVRISLVGNGAFWEVGPDSATASGSAAAMRPRAPVSWSFVRALFFVVFLVVLLLVLSPWLGERLDQFVACGRGRVGFLRHRGSLWALVGGCEHADLRAEDVVVTASLLTVAASPTILMFVGTFAREGNHPNRVMTLLSASSVAAVLGLNAAYVAAHWRPRGTSTLVPAILAGLATLAAILALGLACGPHREATYNLMSGGSPVTVGLIGLSILGLGLWCWRIRLRFLDTHRFGLGAQPLFRDVSPPIARALGAGSEDDADTGLAEIERRLLRVIRNPWTSFSVVPAVVHALLVPQCVTLFVIKRPQTFEPGWRNDLVVAFAFLTFLPITGNFSRLIATWIAFSRLLRRLVHVPAMAGLRRLPSRLARPLATQLALSGSEIVDLAVPVEALESLAAALPSLLDDAEFCASLLGAELRCEAGPTCPSEGILTSSATRAALVERLLDASSRACRERGGLPVYVRALVDDFSAALIAVFIPRYVRHFRLFVPPLVTGSVLGVLMTSLYFMQPQRLIASVVFVWVAAIVLAVFIVYAALDSDPVISAIGNTTAGSVTWNWALLRRIVAWGLFPIASLLAAQYPQFAYGISSLVDAVSKGFR